MAAHSRVKRFTGT